MAIHGIPTGVHRYDKELVCEGYNLFSPYFRNETHLINMEGEIVHTWKSDYFPGLFAHLMPNGDLVRGIRVPNQAVLFAGTTGGFERYDWDGNLLQRYIMNDHETQQVLSHAFCPMPNGNTIVICLEKKSNEEAYARGRIPGTLPEDGEWFEGKQHKGLFLDYLMEIDKDNNVVWEWHLWDHVGDAPDEFNLNYILPPAAHYFSTVDWVHFNAVDYDPIHDRVCMTCRNFGEFVIVDRKTGKLIYRWGNPSTHLRGRKPGWLDDGDQQLFGPHCGTFINEGKHILVHDNGWFRPKGNRSRALEVDIETGQIVWSYESHNPQNFTSPYQSSVQRLPNGNTLICSTGSGQIFEVTPGPQPRVVWEFVCPWLQDGRTVNYLDDTDVLYSTTSHIIKEGHMKNMIHRVYRYAKDYPAFQGKDLSHGVPIDPSIVRLWEMEPFKSGYARAKENPWPQPIAYRENPEVK